MRSSVLDARPPAPPPLTTCRDEQRKHVAHRPRAGRPPVEARARPRSSPNANSRTLIISMLLVLLARAAAEGPVAIAAASASSGTGWQEWLESMIPASANLAAARASEASLQKELQASKADLAAARASEDSVQKELQAARDAAAKATEAAAAEGSSRQQWLGTMIALVITAYVLGRSAAKQAVADARSRDRK